MAAKKAASKKAAPKKGDEPVRVGRAKKQNPLFREAYDSSQKALKKYPTKQMNALVKQAEKVFGKGNFKVSPGGFGINATARNRKGPDSKTNVFTDESGKTTIRNYRGGSGPTPSRKK